MQLSFIPVPQDTNASSTLAGSAADAAALGAATPSAAAAGFAQVLAGVRQPADRTGCPQRSQSPTATTGAGASVVVSVFAPGQTPAGQGTVVLGQTPPADILAGDAPEGVPNDAEGSELGGDSRPVDPALCEVQALAAAMQMPVVPPPAPAPKRGLAEDPANGVGEEATREFGGSGSGRGAATTGSPGQPVLTGQTAAQGNTSSDATPFTMPAAADTANSAETADAARVPGDDPVSDQSRVPSLYGRYGADRAGSPVRDSLAGVPSSRGAEGSSAPVGPSSADTGAATTIPTDTRMVRTPNAADGAPASGAQSQAVATSGNQAAEAVTAAGVDQGKPVAAVRPDQRKDGAAPGTDTTSVGAKSAASDAGKTASAKSRFQSFVRSSLESDNKGLAKNAAGIGIASAEKPATMPSGSTTAFPDAPDAGVSGVAQAVGQTATQSLPEPVALTSSAHRAVEAVLDVTDRFSARNQHSVSLQFTVGDADLKVHVEMRAGEVYTTFRTDSPELRAALATEWQAVAGDTGADRSVKLAAPVFTSNNSSGNSFSAESDGRQRQQDSQAAAQEFMPRFSSGNRGSSAPASSSRPASDSITDSGKSLHLHTLA